MLRLDPVRQVNRYMFTTRLILRRKSVEDRSTPLTTLGSYCATRGASGRQLIMRVRACCAGAMCRHATDGFTGVVQNDEQRAGVNNTRMQQLHACTWDSKRSLGDRSTLMLCTTHRHGTPDLHRLRGRVILIDHDYIKICICIESTHDIKLYEYIKLRVNISSSSTSPT
jgi:hypothetical protein